MAANLHINGLLKKARRKEKSTMSSNSPIFDTEFLRKRITELRELKGITKKDMSSAMGRSHSYIHNIETGPLLPSITQFFSICTCLGITPKEFFDVNLKNPKLVNEILDRIHMLDDKGKKSVLDILIYMVKEKND
jgi:transcriptional regulator with XRE-family HTH domain